MKALSIWQPWASLIADGLKQFETLGWATQYRGPLLICSSRRLFRLDDLPGQVCEFANGRALPLGMAVCVADLVWVGPTEKVRPIVSDREAALGDFSPGRFAWDLRNVRRFKEPWPVREQQGLFGVSDEKIEKHEYEVAE
jgi:hypothetical protein